MAKKNAKKDFRKCVEGVITGDEEGFKRLKSKANKYTFWMKEPTKLNKMMSLIVQKYYGISKAYIKEYVKDCEACSRFNSLKIIQPVYINHIIKKYYLFMMDCLINKTLKFVKDSLKFLFDNFKNALLEAFLTDLNIKFIHEMPCNLKAQGQVERINQTIKRWPAKKLNETEFIETVTTTIIADDLGSDSKIRSDVAKHFKKHRERIIESNNSNEFKKDLSIGDQVLKKKA
ncbi:hypothetical protein CWI38_1838p0020 [Hamiltosporidium tvaerminnensis]|uniref:Integrase catalytic domain-containing protein n=1 Tax=Hamiltosporidium tvaerminnensis TaxID=1176355 RepID=A0A4Q9LS57_9MICR|nr:hypothetical protein CWI38_1838p0020 [Hamiltosporidium tvaerminnensis]